MAKCIICSDPIPAKHDRRCATCPSGCIDCGGPVAMTSTKRCSVCYHRSTLKEPMTIRCEQCGTEIAVASGTRKNNARFCSRSCYLKHRAPTTVSKVCPVCATAFEVSTTIAHRFTVCSRACRRTKTRARTCPRCSSGFWGSQKYCSELCYRPPVYMKCANCRQKFRIQPLAPAAGRRFCCLACYRKHTGETGLEIRVRNALRRLHIGFRQEAQIGRYSVDFLLTGSRIALEADGTYWHRNTERDRRKERWLASHGWRVVRVLESDVETMGATTAVRRALALAEQLPLAHAAALST